TVRPTALAQTAPPSANEVRLTSSGFQPASISITAGESVHWLNETTQGHSIVADGGAFDSGSLEPGAGFSITLTTVGTYAYRSPTSAVFVAEIQVTQPAVPGPPGDPAADHI